MAQSKVTITGLSSKSDGDNLAEKTASVAGVKFVNVNHEQGFAVVTHDDSFNVDDFKAAVVAAGFGA